LLRGIEAESDWNEWRLYRFSIPSSTKLHTEFKKLATKWMGYESGNPGRSFRQPEFAAPSRNLSGYFAIVSREFHLRHDTDANFETNGIVKTLVDSFHYE
jgi:hypothetical protein